MKPISQEEYDRYLQEDLDLLKGLEGLKIVGPKRVNWSPYSRIKIAIGAHNKREEIVRFMDSLPDNFQFMFYDMNFEAPEHHQNGGYVHVKLIQSTYMYFVGHHEWNTPWQQIEKEDLIDYVFSCRAFSREKFEVFHKRKIS
jgi:hypothetical protein